MEWYFWVTLFLYTAICICIYLLYVAPWMSGETATRIGADSDRYWDAVKDVHSSVGTPLVSATGNFLGPVSIGLLLHNGLAVLGFNVFLFLVSIKIAGSIPDVRLGRFGFLLLLNAELLPSIVTLNKEILALLSSVLIAKYLYTQKPTKLFLIAVLAVCFFSRWEEAAMLILFLILRFVFRQNSKTALIFIIACITVAFPLTLRFLGLDLSAFDWLTEGANTILLLNKVQYAFGFPLVVIPKILMLIAGSWISPAFYTANPGFINGFTDPQQEIFQPLGCIALMLLFTYSLWTRRMRLENPIAMFIAITLIVTAATPFIQPRYLYGTYVMLCIELSRPKQLYGVRISSFDRIRKLVFGSNGNQKSHEPTPSL